MPVLIITRNGAAKRVLPEVLPRSPSAPFIKSFSLSRLLYAAAVTLHNGIARAKPSLIADTSSFVPFKLTLPVSARPAKKVLREPETEAVPRFATVPWP